ncbi:hypothetical protein FACS189468_0840 [Spirochaetia bacterium]|nr:hypothetical protein FACS189468_0840 [Spirochaetia bacterium]
MLPLLIVLGIVAVLGLGFLSFFMVRRLHGSPNRVMAAASTSPLQGAVRDDSASRNAELLDSFASRPKTASRPLYRRKDTEAGPFSNPPLLSLFVEDQNTAIGRRNIHILKAGNTFSVGGGSSDFLIFLVSIPRRIGEIRFDGSQCTFTPLKTKYFPDIGSEKVSNCVGKTIRIISDKNYELFFHFEQYRDPLIVLNRLLHSIDVPKE